MRVKYVSGGGRKAQEANVLAGKKGLNMFYPIDVPQPDPNKKQIAAFAVLHPAQSRRLVAKGAVACPIVQKAYKDGMIIIGRGITNAYVSEEFFNVSIENKANQTLGLVADGNTNSFMGPPPLYLARDSSRQGGGRCRLQRGNPEHEKGGRGHQGRQRHRPHRPHRHLCLFLKMRHHGGHLALCHRQGGGYILCR